jgi:hypothetical protein
MPVIADTMADDLPRLSRANECILHCGIRVRFFAVGKIEHYLENSGKTSSGKRFGLIIRDAWRFVQATKFSMSTGQFYTDYHANTDHRR